MANTYAIQKAQVHQGTVGDVTPNVRVYNITNGQTFYGMAVVYLTAGAVSEAPNPLTNATTTVVGVALHAAQAVYAPGITAPANQEIPYITSLFGAGQAGTKLDPTDAIQVHVAHADASQLFEFSNNFVSASGDIGTSHQLAKDATTGYWVVATSTATPVFVIVALVLRPQTLSGGQGGAMPAFGDTNVRYIGYFIQTVVA
jgi:hypothetical protein